MAAHKLSARVYLFILLISFFTITFSTALLFLVKNQIAYMGGTLVGLAILIVYLKLPLLKDQLYWMSRVVFLIGVVVGMTIGRQLSRDAFLGVLIGLPVFDAISFTRAGKNTVNAKVLNNGKLWPKLVIYGKTADGGLLPSIGVGDVCFYAMMTAAVYHAQPQLVWIYDAVLFLGCALNCVVIYFIQDRPWFKGFPATTGPAVVTIAFMILCMMKF